MLDLISLIVPTYNSAHLITTTLNSIWQSTNQNYEVLIIDDGSTDNTKDIVTPYLSDNRFKYVFQVNKGLAGARNTGIEHAKGEYLVFLDSDDVILPEKLVVQSKYLDTHSDVDVAFSDSQWFVEDDLNHTLPVTFPKYEGDVLPYLLFGNFMHVNAVMVRTEKVREVGGFDINFRELEDWDLWMRLAINGSKFGYTPGILSKVRIRKGSMTSDQMRMNKAMVRVLEKNIPILTEKKYPKKIINKAYHALFIFRLKAQSTNHYLGGLLKITHQQGSSFLPVAFKMALKYLFNPFMKQNQTTRELESIWKEKTL